MNKTYHSTCCYCGVGCGVRIRKDAHQQITLTGDVDYPVNKGMLCSKGMNLHHTVNNTKDRLLYPEMRYGKHSPRRRVSWTQALERTALVFKTFIEQYGPDSVAFYASGQCLTEEYYVLNKLIKGYIGSNNIDTNSRLCMSSAVAGYKMSLGEDSVPVCYDDIELTDCIFVAGANPAWCHPILWRRVEAAKAANPNLKIIVSDPRVTQSCAIADVHLQLTPGTDIVLHHALGRCLIELGLTDQSFIEQHTDGFEKYRAKVFEKTIEEAAQICGLSAHDIRSAAQMMGQSPSFITMWTMGLNQSSVGVNKNLSLINLNLITGKIGRAGSGPFSLTGQPNAMGGREVGGMSNLLPAHRNLFDPLDRKAVQDFWGSGEISSKPGLTATEMFEALNAGTLKAIWIMCTNPLTSLPNARLAEAALGKAKFVVVQEISNQAETLQYADVVLPAAAWAEKEGTMTNAERRISHLEQVLPPVGEAKADAQIICEFAQTMGYTGFDYAQPSEIFAEHAALTAGTSIDISGLTYDIIKRARSVQWPYDAASDKSTARLFTDGRFYTVNHKAQIHTVDDVNTSELPSVSHPLILTTGRIRDQWHTMSKTGQVNKLKSHIPQSFVEIHPDDASPRGIENGQLVQVSSLRGEVRVKAVITDSIKRGVVFLPMHWGKVHGSDLNRANNLTHDLVDPISKEPDFKFCAAQVALYVKPKQKIVIVGGGAGACAFVKSYRELNTDDDLVVFSTEDLPFYNRVMLPDYISGEQSWQQLIKMNEAQELVHRFSFKRGLGVVSINREDKTLTDDMGEIHSYDKLVLATGSRAANLKGVPPMSGIFTMRSKYDADAFSQHLSAGAGPVVIIGGGLLGIEMAASLSEMNHEVVVINRTSRVMDRQLDPIASAILQEELALRGVSVFCNDEVSLFFGDEKLQGVRLKSGQRMGCQAVIMAIGTTPNIEYLKSSGLEMKRGVLVNAYLQTNDENIYAIGEIAQFEGAMYGITSAAEQQAGIVAQHLCGNISEPYAGTLLMNILKMHGTDLVSMGLSEAPDDPLYEEVVFIDKSRRTYKKCIIHQDKLVGAILMGDKTEYLEYRDLIQNKTELSDKRLSLLRSGKAAQPVIGKLVCSCAGVGEGNIVQIIQNGCHDFKDLCQQTGAGLGCGSCQSEVNEIFQKQLMLATDAEVFV